MEVNVSLPEDVAAFVEAKVSSGTYGSASEIISDALRLLEALDPANEEALRVAWDEGVASGDVGELDFTALKAEARARYGDPKA